MVLFENVGGKGGIVDAGEVAELENLLYLFGKQPFEVHLFSFRRNYFNIILSTQI